MKEALILILILCALLAAADARGKVGHSLGKRFRVQSNKALYDTSRRLYLPRFLATKSHEEFGNIVAGLGTAALQSAMGYPLGYSPPYPQQYPPGYPGAQPYPAQYPPQYPAASTPVAEGTAEELEGSTPIPGPNLEELEKDQNKAQETLENAEKEADKLKLALDQLTSSMGVNEKKGIQVKSEIVTTTEVSEAEASKSFEKAAERKSQFAPPVIVLLRPETTPRDKLEFAKAIACKGAGRPGENAKLAEMASIKGKTKQELEDEIKKTEQKLEKAKGERKKIHEELRTTETQAVEGANVKADVEFLKADLEDKDKEIATLIHKLQALEHRKESLNVIAHKKDVKEVEGMETNENEEQPGKKNFKQKLHDLFKRKPKKEKNEEETESEEIV